MTETPFRAQPYSSLELIKSAFRELDLEVLSRSPRSLVLLYPPGVLSAVLWELVDNARRHSVGHCKIRVGWNIKDGRFSCTVHDTSPSMLPCSFKGFADAHTLSEIGSVEVEDTRGIGLIRNVMSTSGGKLLFARSRLLGGNLVLFSFPVSRFHIRGSYGR
jgi:signal transduction histidine kinase